MGLIYPTGTARKSKGGVKGKKGRQKEWAHSKKKEMMSRQK